jgi:hypothetical protein
MRVGAVLLAIVMCAALAGCGARTSRGAGATPAALRTPAPAPAPLSTASASCSAVVERTLRAIGARITARAALHGSRSGRSSALVATLTRPVPSACAATAGQTVANTVGVVGERLVRVEQTGPAVQRALAEVARDPAFVRAVQARDPKALRTQIVHFFRIPSLHIVRVRATTAAGHVVGDVGGPDVIAPASRTIRGAHGQVVGRVTLSVQDDTGYIKLMRRFAGAGAVLRTSAGVVPGSASAPSRIPARGTIVARGAGYAAFAFTTQAFPARRLDVALLVPLTTGRQPTATASSPPSSATPAAANAA